MCNLAVKKSSVKVGAVVIMGHSGAILDVLATWGSWHTVKHLYFVDNRATILNGNHTNSDVGRKPRNKFENEINYNM